MKMRKHHCARLKHAKGQIFTCGMFGTCSDSVLSPRTPPPALVISNPIPPVNAGTQKSSSNVDLPPKQPDHKPLQSIKTESPQQQQELEKKIPQPQTLSDIVLLPPSPDTVTQEKLISQWDFGLKQQQQQQQQQQQKNQEEELKRDSTHIVSIDLQIPSNNHHQQQQQQQEFFKERYVGLVDRDLSPFQFPRLAPAAPVAQASPAAAAAGAPKPDQSLESLIRDALAGRFSKPALRSLRGLAEESEKNKRSIIAAGVPESLISLLSAGPVDAEKRDVHLLREALALLALLADEEHTQQLISRSKLLPAINQDLRRRSLDAWILVCKLSTSDSLIIDSSCPGVLEACVALLKDPSAEAKLVRLALKAMLGICLIKQNRVPAVRAGAVEALLETLIDLHGVDGGDFCSRSGIVVNVERALATLELLCTSGEGRAAICNQPGFISELVGLVLGVSERATEYAAGVLCAVLCDNMVADGVPPGGVPGINNGAAGGIPRGNLTLTQLSDRNSSWHSSVQEMAVKGGAPAQMLLVMQSDCSDRARRKAAKLLKALHKYGEDHNTIHSDLASTITY